jgi:hypothetical protein
MVAGCVEVYGICNADLALYIDCPNAGGRGNADSKRNNAQIFKNRGVSDRNDDLVSIWQRAFDLGAK